MIKSHSQKAFTVIEIMTVLVIVAIVASLAVPAFSGFVKNNRLTTFANNFANSVALAKSEALTRRSEIIVSPKSGGWVNGWTVKAGTLVLNDHPKLTGLKIETNPESVAFTSKGLLKKLNWSGIKACDDRNKCREITLSGLGIVSIKQI